MRSAVVNNDIVFSSQQATQDNLANNDFVSELVNYVVLQTPAKNITDGSNAEFSLQTNIKGNGVFWGDPKDAIANNLFKNVVGKKSAMPSALEGIG